MLMSFASGIVLTVIGFLNLIPVSVKDGGWRWTYSYLVIFCLLSLLVATVSRWRGSRVASALVIASLLIVLGAVVPAAVVATFTLSAFVLGRLLLRDPRIAATDHLLVGIVVFGTVLSLLVHLPINNTGTWALLFLLPLIIGWRHVKTLWPATQETTPKSLHLYLLHCAITSAILLHVLVGLMPETGHDALAMHLFVPAYVAYHQAWHFDVATYVWAVMPMFVDWIYALGYMFAGETGARLLNVGSILLLTSLVYRVALWAGADRKAASWGALLLLVTPITFRESSTLLIEGMWSALVVGGILAILRLLTKSSNERADLLLGGLMLGGALAAKAVTFTILPVLLLVVLVGARRLCSRDLLQVTGFALLVFLVIGLIPYVTAYVLTGNPVFPFFNAYFKSPLYPMENFQPPAIFGRGVSWDTLFQMTFNSGKYREATVGAAGFQWLLLVMPGALAGLLAWHRGILLLTLIAAGSLWLTFGQMAYLRYILPTFALACALVGAALVLAASTGLWTSRVAVTVALATLVLNLLHFDSGTYNGQIDLSVIIDPRARAAYLDNKVPIRSAVMTVNGLNHELNPVAFFSAPLVAGLKADALCPSWYNHRFQTLVLATDDAQSMGSLLGKEGVQFLVVDNAWGGKKISSVIPFVNKVSTELLRINAVSIRRLKERFLYSKELLPSTTFESGWHFVPGAILLSDNQVQVNVTSPVYSKYPVKVQSGKKYHYVAEAHCATTAARGRLQVIWMRRDHKRIRSDIEIFNCTVQPTTYIMDVCAPDDANFAVVYATGHEHNPIIFSKVSFRYYESE